MKTVVTLGEILVEILARDRDQSFRGPGPLVGPFPSGAPAIFIDQAARLGQPCAIIGCVGDDDFGRLNIDRLQGDGVDVSAIEVHADMPTGSAFVTYRSDGERHFIFNIAHSAAGQVNITQKAEQLLDRADHLHVMGSSLFSEAMNKATAAAVSLVKQRGGTVSFDPNVRTELAGGRSVAERFGDIVDHCDVLLPSGPELQLIAGAADEDSAVSALLERGIGAIAVKRGAQGADYYDRTGKISVAPLPVQEADPTGAGDCFGAAFVTCWLRDMPPQAALTYANAAGAWAVAHQGPMEGVSTFAQLDGWLAEVALP